MRIHNPPINEEGKIVDPLYWEASDKEMGIKDGWQSLKRGHNAYKYIGRQIADNGCIKCGNKDLVFEKSMFIGSIICPRCQNRHGIWKADSWNQLYLNQFYRQIALDEEIPLDDKQDLWNHYVAEYKNGVYDRLPDGTVI